LIIASVVEPTQHAEAGRRFLDTGLDDFLGNTASEEPIPGAASAAAVAIALGAALVAMVGRRSLGSWGDAAGVVAQAQAIRSRTMSLAEAAADAYRAALTALEERPHGSDERRDHALGVALSTTVSFALRLAETAVDVAHLGVLAAERGDQAVRAEAVGAILLAEAGARSAAAIVALNLVMARDDERVTRARTLADEASLAARRAALPA
jgi:methenyltetrahydrofolate cyclohydrolase